MMASESYVPPERTGWRDSALSRFHREGTPSRPAGKRLPFNDLDSIWVEWNSVWPAAFVEAKHAGADVDRTKAWFSCLRNIANTQQVPGLLIIYNITYDRNGILDESIRATWFKLYAVNDIAKLCFKIRSYREGTQLTANEFLDFQHFVRGWAENGRLEREAREAREGGLLTRIRDLIVEVAARIDERINAIEWREIARGDLYPGDEPDDEPDEDVRQHTLPPGFTSRQDVRRGPKVKGIGW